MNITFNIYAALTNNSKVTATFLIIFASFSCFFVLFRLDCTLTYFVFCFFFFCVLTQHKFNNKNVVVVVVVAVSVYLEWQNELVDELAFL